MATTLRTVRLTRMRMVRFVTMNAPAHLTESASAEVRGRCLFTNTMEQAPHRSARERLQSLRVLRRKSVDDQVSDY